jgi:hypothetical protein
MADKNYAPMTEQELAEVKAFDLEIYNIKQTAAILKVTERSIMNYLKKGQLKGRKVGGRWMFAKEDITKFAGQG